MSRNHPYYFIQDEEDENTARKRFQRAQRKEVVTAKRFIGSGEDADIYQQLMPVNARQNHPEPR